MSLDATATLCDLIALPSVNPMGAAVSSEIEGESRVTDYLEQIFRRWQVPWQRQLIEQGRENIAARIDGDPNRLLMFEVHQDTVPVAGMTVPPFGGNLEGGRVYGRGACDVKGGMAAMLVAAERILREKPAGRPTLIVACSVNEEYGFSGAEGWVELWEQPDSVIPRQPDVALIAEPTMLDVVVAHKGVVRWRCHVHGKAAHTSQPQLGENAIYGMGRVVAAIENYHEHVLPVLRRHPLCGQPTVCVSTVHGGMSINTVPAHCVIEIDRRLLPGEDPEQAYQGLIDHVATMAGGQRIEHEPPYRAIAGLSDQSNGPLARALAEAARPTKSDCEIVGVPYGTNASVIAAAGVPCVVFGPGSIDQAHTVDEWLAVEQLEGAAQIYYDFAAGAAWQ